MTERITTAKRRSAEQISREVVKSILGDEIEREKERYRILVGLGIAAAGLLELESIGRPKVAGGWRLAAAIILAAAGVHELRKAS